MLHLQEANAACKIEAIFTFGFHTPQEIFEDAIIVIIKRFSLQRCSPEIDLNSNNITSGVFLFKRNTCS